MLLSEAFLFSYPHIKIPFKIDIISSTNELSLVKFEMVWKNPFTKTKKVKSCNLLWKEILWKIDQRKFGFKGFWRKFLLFLKFFRSYQNFQLK